MDEKKKNTSDDAGPRPRPFRAIIVGGGLLGLTAAHMFARTEMDYVVLEQHDDLAPAIGSLLTLNPPTFRVLDQLGLLDAVQPGLNRVDNGVFMSAVDGSVWKKERLTHLLEVNHGHGMRVIHRPVYVKALYESLPASAKARVHVRKRVVRIDAAADGVTVHCADGTVEHGSIVIGADGVHSRTRQIMQSLAAKESTTSSSSSSSSVAIAVSEEEQQQQNQDQPSPYTTTYRLLFGNLPVLPDLAPATNYEGAAQGVSTQILTGAHQAWFGIYEALPAPTRARKRWTEADKQAMLARWGDLHMAPGGHTVSSVFARRKGDLGLISLEEGLVRGPWHGGRGRVVLVGDAVRKLEPHAGLGYNCGVTDLVDLVNRLRDLTRRQVAHGGQQQPTSADLEAIFDAYQNARMVDMPSVIDFSESRARTCAWLTTRDWFMARFLVPWLPFGRYAIHFLLGSLFARAPVLTWIPEKRLPARAMPYLHHPKLEGKENLRYSGSSEPLRWSSRLPVVAGTLVLAAVATAGLRFYELR